MRTILYSLALLAMSCTSMAQNPVKQSGPQISVDKVDIDFGTIKQGADGNREFVVTNTGDAPLVMTSCTGSCGCTVPKCDTAPIAPGKTSVVNVHYDTNRIGPFTKTVTVTSNAVNEPSKIVNIHGTVEAPDAPAPATAPSTPVPAPK